MIEKTSNKCQYHIQVLFGGLVTNTVKLVKTKNQVSIFKNQQNKDLYYNKTTGIFLNSFVYICSVSEKYEGLNFSINNNF